MTDRERTALAEALADTNPTLTLAGTLKTIGLCVVGWGFCVCLAATLISWNVHPILGGLVGGVIAIFAILCLYVIILSIQAYFHWRGVDRTFFRDNAPVIREVLVDGRVHVKSVSATAVIVLEEYEDEGSGYIFDVGGGQILYLKGQQYFPLEDGDSFPNAEFEIVRTVVGNLDVGLFCYGNELEPDRVMELSDFPAEVVWSNREELIPAEMTEFAESLRETS